MHAIHPIQPNVLAGSPLDRVGHRRTDEPWIAAHLADPATLTVPVWRARNLMRTTSGTGEVHLLPAAELAAPLAAHPWAFLGLLDEKPLFAVDLSALDDPLPHLPEGVVFQDLRRIGGNAALPDAAIMGHARGLMHWRARHRFCGVCGAACAPASQGNRVNIRRPDG
jgi:NAD+ diphosphatase